MPGPNPTNNYIGSFNFMVKVEGFGTELDGFTSCTGIKSVTEVFDFKHGYDTHVRKAAGRTTYEPITLERVYSGLDEFAAWRDRIEAGNIERRNVIIEYHTNNRTVVARFRLMNAFPSRWESPDLNALGSDAAIEKIELSYERAIREVAKGHLGGEWWDAMSAQARNPELPDWVSGAVSHGKAVNPATPDWVKGSVPLGKSAAPPTRDWVKGNVPLGKSAAPPKRDWVHGNVGLGKAKGPNQPGWVKGSPPNVSTRTPPQRDWLKKAGADHKPQSMDYPDWVLKY
jgi:phage tail-like protein